MPNPKAGEEIHIPCRHCSGTMITTVARVGSAVLTCTRCHGRTRLEMDQEKGTIRVRTSPVYPD